MFRKEDVDQMTLADWMEDVKHDEELEGFLLELEEVCDEAGINIDTAVMTSSCLSADFHTILEESEFLTTSPEYGFHIISYRGIKMVYDANGTESIYLNEEDLI